jgi:hypothetical protein
MQQAPHRRGTAKSRLQIRLHADLCGERLPGPLAAFDLNRCPLNAKAKTTISENEFRFSHSLVLGLRGALFPRAPPFVPAGSKGVAAASREASEETPLRPGNKHDSCDGPVAWQPHVPLVG